MTLGFNALKGMKTNSFARNIAGDENAVTIDVWMMRAAGLNVDSPNKTQYKELSQAVTDVALATLELDQLLRALLQRISQVLGGETATVFTSPRERRTQDYITGRFG